jgi:RNA polymerase sigma-70 factor, ECF subfamily
VYLVFNAGYSAETTGAELSREAIRLGRLLLDLLPEPEVMGLLGLMLLQESRRAARSSAEGELILQDQQDRLLWNRDLIAEGIALTESALRSRRFGAYTLQAAIAAVHAEASSAAMHGLAPNHAALRPADSSSTISGRGTQPRSCRRHVRRSGAGSSSHR